MLPTKAAAFIAPSTPIAFSDPFFYDLIWIASRLGLG
jgi:hypothetical protein